MSTPSMCCSPLRRHARFLGCALACLVASLGTSAGSRAFAGPPKGCLVLGDDTPQDVRPGDVVKSFNQSSTNDPNEFPRIAVISRPPFLQPGGHKNGPPAGFVTLNYCQIVGKGRPGLYWLKIRHSFINKDTGVISFCVDFRAAIRLLPPLCKAPPVCELSQAGPIEATIGGEPVEFTVCVEAGCEGAHAALTLEDLPGFLGLQGESRDTQGRCCYTFRIYPCSDDAGEYTVTFKAKNTDGGAAEGECSVDIVILEGEE